MLRGCLVMLAVLLAGYFTEKHFVSSLGLLYPEVVSGFLAFCLASMAGAIHGTFVTHGRGLGKDGSSTTYEEGKLVRVSGQLRLLTPSVISPLSNRGAAAYSYRLASALPGGDQSLDTLAMVRGLGMAACEIVTSNGSIRLEGFPDLQHFPEETIDPGPALARLAKRPTTRLTPDLPKFGIDGGSEDFANQTAEQRLASDPARYQWTAAETLLVPGATVTAQGTYHANPPRLKIDTSFLTLTHELKPGDGAELAQSEVQTQWIGMIIFLAVGTALHAFVYAAEGRYCKAFLQWASRL